MVSDELRQEKGRFGGPANRAEEGQGAGAAGHPGHLCTFLVSSCDGYADLWEPYFNLVRLRWPDCPFPVKLITEELEPDIPGVEALRLGRGHDWSSLLLRALDHLGTPHVLFSLEDFFLRETVDTKRVLGLYNSFREHRLRMLRLIPRPAPDLRLNGIEFGLVAPGTPYRVSTQAAFWDVATLRALLVRGESAWEFEVQGTPRSERLDGFASVWRAALPYRHHVVEKGRWFPWDAWQFSRLAIGVDLDARPTMSASNALLWLARKAAKTWLYRKPAHLLRRIRARRSGRESTPRPPD